MRVLPLEPFSVGSGPLQTARSPSCARSDKTKSLGVNSLITVVKIGQDARRFRITNLDETQVLLDERLPPGDAIIMTTAANKLFKHGVPPEDVDHGKGWHVKPSGSIVFRTVTDKLTDAELLKRIQTLHQAQAKRAEQKDERKRKREAEAERDGDSE